MRYILIELDIQGYSGPIELLSRYLIETVQEAVAPCHLSPSMMKTPFPDNIGNKIEETTAKEYLQ